MTSCDIQNNELDIDITQLPPVETQDISPEPTKPEFNIEDLGPVYSLKNYDSSEMIKIPYIGFLPEGVELVYNDENATIYKCFNVTGEGYYFDWMLDMGSGVRSGKILYKEFTSGDGESWVYGYMNSDFSLLTEGIYDRAFPFEDGSAVVKTKEGFGVINTDGNYVLPCEFKYMPELIGDIIKVPRGEEDDMKIYHCANRKTGDFIYTLKITYIRNDDSYRYFKIYSSGKEEEVFDASEFVKNELKKFRDENTRLYGYKDVFGNIVVDAQYGHADEFSEEYARVWQNGYYGYINNDGDLVIPCEYTSADQFRNGLAKVVKDGSVLYITETGEPMVDRQFVAIKGYNEDVAPAVQIGDEYWSYVDYNGDAVFDKKFAGAGKFSHGLALVESIDYFEDYFESDISDNSGNKYISDVSQNKYYINKQGEPAFGILTFEEATDINEEGYAIAYNVSGVLISTSNGQVMNPTAIAYYIIISRIN
ncbi:MAG: WG repeat-containing protein [Clostridiales bacterium]|nr:WG repeat-containing protein [Clostridiales bacterium]